MKGRLYEREREIEERGPVAGRKTCVMGVRREVRAGGGRKGMVIVKEARSGDGGAARAMVMVV